MFRKQSDFEAFERVMVEAHQRQPIRILSCELDGSCQRAFDCEGARQVRVSIERGRPYGGDEWVRQTVKDLGLEHTVRPEGRPRKASQSATDSTK
jgi:hypothetical protein